MDQEVVKPGGRDRVAQGFERQAVVAGGKLKLVLTDHRLHGGEPSGLLEDLPLLLVLENLPLDPL